MRRSTACALAWLLVGRVAIAQVAAPARDRPNGPPRPPEGRGAIAGRVVDAQTGHPIARARVRLNGIGPGIPRPPVTTDESGAFAFSHLPAGAFMLFVEKPAYAAARYPEAGLTLRNANRPFLLADGETLDRLVVPLQRPSAMTGRVLDEHGDPLEYAQVQAFRLPASGRGKPQARQMTSTNDLGEFRLARLEPGRYVVFAWSRQDLGGGFMGRPAGTGAHEPRPVPTFYPGVLAMNQAQPIAVGRGTTIANVDIVLIDGMTAEVSGTLIGSSGEPERRGSISVRPIMKDVVQGGYMSGGTSLQPDGTFQLSLPPGEYELEGRNMPTFGAAGRDEEVGSVRLTVASDMSGIVIQLGRTARISGRVVFDGAAPLPAVPTGTQGQLVFVQSVDGSMCRSRQLEITPDWTFVLDGLFGTCTARSFGSLGPWLVKSVLVDGKDWLDEPIAFAPGQQMRGVEIVMSDKTTELMFHVTDERGTLTREYVGLVFPVDNTKWSETGGSRYIRPFVPPPDPPPSTNGDGTPGTPGTPGGTLAFVGGTAPGTAVATRGAGGARRELVSGLPAGEYFAVAVDDLGVDSVRDPEILEQLSRVATRVTLTYGSPQEVNLRRIALARSR